MKKAYLSLLAGAAALGFAANANAATFNLIDTGGVAGSPAQLDFQIAADYWGSVLTNNVTVNLGVGFSSDGFDDPDIIGQTGSADQVITYSKVKKALNANTSKSALDVSADANLQSGKSLKLIKNAPYQGKKGSTAAADVYDTDTSGNNKALDVNTAVAKALGIAADYSGSQIASGLDGDVTFNSAFSFDFDPTDGIAAGKIDFIGVAVHEIGHALGFVSGVDTYDYCNDYFTGVCATNLNKYAIGSTLDLFRYSNDPNKLVPGKKPVLDWSTGTASYFSYDGGATQALGGSLFSTGYYTGDGNQASHWKDLGGCTTGEGIMDPNFCYAQMGDVTALDLAAFDAMGWNTSVDVLANPTYNMSTSQMYNQFGGNAGAVPEPASWAMFILGFGAVGSAFRRRAKLTGVSYSQAV